MPLPHLLRLLAALPLVACLESKEGDGAPADAVGASATDAAATTAARDTASATAAPDTAATTSATTSAPDTSTTTEPDTTTGECTALGLPCMFQGECCSPETTFCNGGPYYYGECTARLANGVPCGRDGDCRDGVCREGVCATPDCTTVAGACEVDDDCCTGWCEFTYAGSSCMARLADGQACHTHRMCASGQCHDGVCAPVCQAAGEGCLYDSDCCADTFCGTDDGDPLRKCIATRANGEACEWDGQCASGACPAGTCEALGCFETEASCFSDLECCSGACSQDGMSYALGFCFEPAAGGTACVRDAWCRSGHCVEGLCAP